MSRSDKSFYVDFFYNATLTKVFDNGEDGVEKPALDFTFYGVDGFEITITASYNDYEARDLKFNEIDDEMMQRIFNQAIKPIFIEEN